MAKIKFKMTVKEIAFDFEGDYEQAKAIQQGISNTLNGLSSLQNRAMGLPDTNGQPKMIENRPVDSPNARRKRRSPRTSPVQLNEQANGEASGDASANGDGQEEPGEGTPRRVNGASPTGLLVALRKNGFFAERRGMAQIIEKIHTDGFPSIKNGDISGKLVKLCQRQVLKREKNEDGNWVYEQGPSEE